ncbi:MAG: COG4223 family protein, partial [Alphaproteobacteria bacterium]
MAPTATALLVLIVGAVAATPYWAPAVMQMLPWGTPALSQPAPKPAPAPATHDDALAARVAALEAQAGNNPNDVALQVVAKRLSSLEARPGPDLTPLQNELTALAASVADLTQKIGTIDKAQVAPADGTALALLLLQIRGAVDTGRPFDAEYQALTTLSRAHPDIAAAAVSLAEPAKSGVASRAVLATRLHQLAPQIAAAVPAASSWRSQIVARLRSLVTIRRIDGAGRSPAEVAVTGAERALAGGDLKAAIDALSGLGGANLAAAQPWL